MLEEFPYNGPNPVDGEGLLGYLAERESQPVRAVGVFIRLLAERLGDSSDPTLYAYTAEGLLDDCRQGIDSSGQTMPHEITGLNPLQYQLLGICARTWGKNAFPAAVEDIDDGYFSLGRDLPIAEQFDPLELAGLFS